MRFGIHWVSSFTLLGTYLYTIKMFCFVFFCSVFFFLFFCVCFFFFFFLLCFFFVSFFKLLDKYGVELKCSYV